MNQYVVASDCFPFVRAFPDHSIDLLLTDPPYFGIVNEGWDNQRRNIKEYVEWFVNLLRYARVKMRPTASVIFFGGVGKHGLHPFFDLLDGIERTGLYEYRNLITWAKRRAYGKSHDYLFCREEIAWYSVSSERTKVTFHIPYLYEKRGYPGWNKDHPAKSAYKRVSNVWTDIPELMRPERTCQKPVPLMERLVATHSNPGDLVVDPFAGWGTTGVAALKLGRRFLGCEAIEADAHAANERCAKVAASCSTNSLR